MLFRRRDQAKKRNRGDVVAVLDIGSSKVCCLIARLAESGVPQIVGVGHYASEGIKSGMIIDLDAASRSIGQAIQTAERYCKQSRGEVSFDDVTVSLSASMTQSCIVSVEVPIYGHEVKDSTIARALARTRHVMDPDFGEIIHAIPLSFSIDGRGGIKDPRGMFGNDLVVQIHVISAAESALRNLETAVGRWHLGIEGFACSAYTSGLATLVEDEMELGATLIDMGGGVTSYAIFMNGSCIHVGAVPVGGKRITEDLAFALSTPISEAERTKVLHGSVIGTITDIEAPINIPQIGERDAIVDSEVSKSILTGIIQPRVEETLELVRAQMEASGFDKLVGPRVVITGGGSQLPGMREMTQLILDKKVRLGRPSGRQGDVVNGKSYDGEEANAEVRGLPPSFWGPAFAGTVGLLNYAILPEDRSAVIAFEAGAEGGFFSRVTHWLRENI